MDIKNEEAGRSILEILAVLAIAMILSMVGLYGYRHSSNKHQANELIEEANEVAVLVATHLSQKADESGEDEDEYAESTYELTDEDFKNIPLGRNNTHFGVKRLPGPFSKQFALVTSEMTKEVCDILLKSIGEASLPQYLVDSEGYALEECDENNLENIGIVYDVELQKGLRLGSGKNGGSNENNKSDENGGSGENGGSNGGDNSAGNGNSGENGEGGSGENGDGSDNGSGEGDNPDEKKEDSLNCDTGLIETKTGCQGCNSNAECAEAFGGNFVCNEENKCEKVECTSNAGCAESYGTIFICKNNTCVTEKGCTPDKPIYSHEHCCPTKTPYWNGQKCISRENSFEGADGNDYSCSTNYAVIVKGVEFNCSLCPNREILGNAKYCVPKCGSGKFLTRKSDNQIRPEVYCENCSTSTQWMNGPLDCSYCSSRCPGRECYQLGYNPQFQCQLKECPSGNYSYWQGCASCDELIARPFAKWYTATGEKGLRYNAVASCEACNGRYGRRKATTSGARYCYLENCPNNYFRATQNHGSWTSKHDCVSCASGTSYVSTEEDCQKCVDANGHFTRHFERGYCVKGAICANGQEYNAETGCGGCPEGKFFVSGRCVDCDSEAWFEAATDSNECKRCPQREMHTVTTGVYTPTTCMLKPEIGKTWWSTLGTLSCTTTQKAPTPGVRADDCLKYCPNRVVTRNWTCALPCQKDEFLGAKASDDPGSCYSCDTEESYMMVSITKRENNTNVTSTPTCSQACPGKRFNRDGYCIKCYTDPSKYKTKQECESCRGSWNGDDKTCTLPSESEPEPESEPS